MSKFFDDVKRELEKYGIEGAIRRLFPAAEKDGDSYKIADIHGGKGNSLRINTKEGWWKDYNAGDRGGDLISLWAVHKGFPSQSNAANDLMDKLDLKVAQNPVAKRKEELKAVFPVPVEVGSAPYSLGETLFGKPDFKLNKVWDYRNLNGELLFHIMRYEQAVTDGRKSKKEIRPYCWCGPEAGWRIVGPGKTDVPLYGLPALKEKAAAPVLIVEGEKAADAARAIFLDHAVVSWQGGAKSIKKADWSPLKGREIIYWPDADEPGASSVNELRSYLGAVKVASLAIVQVPTSLPAGWDLADPVPEGIDVDVLLQGAEKTDLSAVSELHEMSLPEVLGRFYYLIEEELFAFPAAELLLTSTQFNAAFRHLMARGGANIANFFLEKFPDRKLVRMGYRPGHVDEVFYGQKGMKTLNMWRPSDVQPQSGDASPFVEHLQFLCSSDEEFEALANTLAHWVQAPGVKLHYAPLIVGRQGTGKSYLAKVMKKLLGHSNVTDVETRQLNSNFNDYLRNTHLVIIHELMAVGRRGVANTMKSMLADEALVINVKYQDSRVEENYVNFLLFSNHDDAIHIEDGDRRYLVISSSEPRKVPEYYNRLFQWTDENYGVILSWLLDRDLSKFSPKSPPIMTTGKSIAQELSLPDWEIDLRDAAENGRGPFAGDLFQLDDIAHHLSEHDGLNKSMLTKAVRSIGAAPLGQHKLVVDGRQRKPSLWALRNAKLWMAVPQAERVRAYDNHGTYDLFTNPKK